MSSEQKESNDRTGCKISSHSNGSSLIFFEQKCFVFVKVQIFTVEKRLGLWAKSIFEILKLPISSLINIII